jgi:ribosomal protein S18 acetylase RimI-like enzyme
MQIVTLAPAHLPALYDLYLRQIADVPHSLTPSRGAFATSLQGASEKLLVAEVDGQARGFAAFAHVKDGSWEADAIVALFFDDPAAGAELLQACAARATGPELHAFPATHAECPVPGYNGGWDGLSDRVPHVAQLLARHGFGPHFRELHLTLDLVAYTPEERAVPGSALQEQIGERDALFQVLDQGRELAACYVKLLGGYYDDPRAASIGYVDWLWVDESLRRRGVARMLMHRALTVLKRRGCATCWLTTTADNWPAQPLYLSLGVSVVDCSASFKRSARATG